MKTIKPESQLKKSAGFLWLFNAILYLVAFLLGYVFLFDILIAAAGSGSVDIEAILQQALVAAIAVSVIELILLFTTFINWLQFLRLWKWYGPRFWRCLIVILGILGFLFWVTSLVLYFGFGIII